MLKETIDLLLNPVFGFPESTSDYEMFLVFGFPESTSGLTFHNRLSNLVLTLRRTKSLCTVHYGNSN
jgi:hypothetical protein